MKILSFWLFLKSKRCVFPDYFVDFLLLCKTAKEDEAKKKEIQLCAQTANATLNPDKARQKV